MSWKVLYFTKGAYVSINKCECINVCMKECMYQLMYQCINGTSSSLKELVSFENDMMDMIKNLEFKRVNNEFQSNLRNDIRQIRRSNNLFISADKSRNIYKVSKASYERMMHENVTKTYKKCNTNKSNSINFKAKPISNKLKIDDRVQKLDENEAYVTIKDHKEGFLNKISYCLINPSK